MRAAATSSPQRAGRRVRAGFAALVLLVSLLTGPADEPAAATGRSAVAAVAAVAAAAVTGAVVTYVPPAMPLRVLRPFQAPATPYGAGHRGVDIQVPASRLVRAAGRGTVSFAGPVAGRGVLVIAHPDGVRTEYEPVTPLVRRGTAVAAGEVIARLDGTDPGCAAPRCLHWGARRGADYLDPLSLLRPLGPVRLLPWRPDG